MLTQENVVLLGRYLLKYLGVSVITCLPPNGSEKWREDTNVAECHQSKGTHTSIDFFFQLFGKFENSQMKSRGTLIAPMLQDTQYQGNLETSLAKGFCECLGHNT